jgi:DNA polymerase-4
LGYEPDLFEIENDVKNRRLQEAIDLIQGRYGAGAVMRGVVLAAATN